MSKPTILIADDNKTIHETLKSYFSSYKYNVIDVYDGPEALRQTQEKKPDVILLDIVMPGPNGLEILKKLKALDKDIPVIIMTAFAGAPQIPIEAYQNDCFDIVLKPFKLSEISAIIENALSEKQYKNYDKNTNNIQIKGPQQNIPIIGQSKKMQEIFKLIGRVINTNASVLIQGDTGTGKDLIAQILHYNSRRHLNPFKPVNCAAIPSELLESELFGHEKGSFTTAINQKKGMFEHANEGTIFLDEIGDMPLDLQSKILRVLSNQTFTRIGGDELIKTNARIIAATNINLQQAVENKIFRCDLFFRLKVVTINLPPLRERKEDIDILLEYFLSKYNKLFQKNVFELSDDCTDIMKAYDWPGNIRELENTIQHSIIMAAGHRLLPEYLPQEITNSYYQSNIIDNGIEISDNKKITFPLGLALEDVKDKYILETLKMLNFNQTEAANTLHVHRNTIGRFIKEQE